MSYDSRIKNLRNKAIADAYEPKWIAGKIYSECCTNAVSRSRFEAFTDRRTAFCAATEFIGDYDLSTTEFARPEDIDVETSDPACERAEAELEKYGQITLGDYRIIFEELTADDIPAVTAGETIMESLNEINEEVVCKLGILAAHCDLAAVTYPTSSWEREVLRRQAAQYREAQAITADPLSFKSLVK